MITLSERATMVLNHENLQVINVDIWHDIQNPKMLRCELYWLDKHDNQVTVEVPLYALRQANDKVGHGCVINLVCPNGAFIPSAVTLELNGSVTLDLPYDPLIIEGEFNAEASYDTNIIVTEQEVRDAQRRIVKAILH